LSLRYGWSKLPWTPANAAENVVLHRERLGEPLRWRKPRMVFVNSMSDLFHEEVPEQFIIEVFAVMAAASQHTFQVLTKRPERMRAFTWALSWLLPNVWLGVSVENQRWTARIDDLRTAPAVVRFLSCEPLLGPLELDLRGIDWVIVGGESGPRYRPMRLEWLADIVAQCDAAGVPVHVKQDSGRRPGQQGRIPDHLWRRKEFPGGAYNGRERGAEDGANGRGRPGAETRLLADPGASGAEVGAR